MVRPKVKIEFFRKALAIHSSLAASNPDGSEYRYAAGVDYEYVGIAFNKLGDLTGDTENYRAALENHPRSLKLTKLWSRQIRAMRPIAEFSPMFTAK